MQILFKTGIRRIVISPPGKVEAATQSFIHALIRDVLRNYGNGALDQITFKSCNETIKKIVNIVVDYMQSGMGIPGDAFD